MFLDFHSRDIKPESKQHLVLLVSHGDLRAYRFIHDTTIISKVGLACQAIHVHVPVIEMMLIQADLYLPDIYFQQPSQCGICAHVGTTAKGIN